jgi:hypothetical protein
MATSALATAFVNIVPGTTEVEKYLKGGLGNQAGNAGTAAGNSFSSGFGNSLRKIGGLITGALATGAVAHFTKELISAGEEEIAGNNRLTQIAKSMGIFGDQAGTVAQRLSDLAGQQQLNLGIDDDTIKLTQAKLLTFKQLATSADEVGGYFDRATQASLDLAAAGFGTAETNAVQLGKALQDPIKGITALARSGVTFTEQEKSKIATLVKSNQMGEAQALVLKAIETQVGGTAAATATSSGKMEQAFENLKETLGLLLLPTFQKVAGYITTSVIPAISNFVDQFKAGKTPLNDFLNQMKAAWDWGVKYKDILIPLAVAIGAGYLAFQTWTTAVRIGTAVQFAYNAVMAANPIMLVVIAVAALTAGLIWFFTQTKTGQAIWSGFVGFLSDSGKNIVKAWNAVVAWFGSFPAKVGAFFSNAGTWLLNAGKHVIEGLINGFKNGVAMLGGAVKGIADTVVNGFKNLLGIHSPSKVFHEFGKNIMQGLRNGLTGEKSKVSETMTKVRDWLVSAFDSKKISKAQEKAGLALIKAFSGPLQKYETQYKGVLEALDKAQEDLQNKIEARASYVSNLASKYGSTLDTSSLVTDAGKQADAKDALASAQAKLNDLMAKQPDPLELADATNDLVKAQAKYNDVLKDTSSKTYEIEDARIAAAKAQQKLDNLKASATQAEVTAAQAEVDKAKAALAEAQMTPYERAVQQLKDRIAKSKELKSVTDQLLAMGLDKGLYQQIVESGAVDFAKSIIEGGAGAVTELNVLAKEADSQALTLANKVGDVLYGQGIKFAQSVVDGLNAQKKDLETLMTAVAGAFETAIGNIVKGSKTDIKTALTDAQAFLDGAVSKAKAAIAAAAPKVTATPTTSLDSTERKTPVKTTATVANPVLPLAGNGSLTQQVVNYYAAPNESLTSEQQLVQAVQRVGRIL